MLPDITDINGLKFLMQMHFLYLKKKVSSIEKLPNPLEKIFSKKGGTEDPMELYKRFRGHEPSIKALMQRDGILNE